MFSSQKRIQDAFQVRKNAAKAQRDAVFLGHPTNGDEARYPSKIASFSKGLPHDKLGVVRPEAYQALVSALSSGASANFETIPLGLERKFVNPQAGLAFDLQGPDSQHVMAPPPPAFASAEEAGEIGENYWMALARDVHFSDYESTQTTIDAAADLSQFSDFRGPKDMGQITPNTLFRGTTPGDLVGPYLSQFMLHNVPFGAQTIEQKMKTVQHGFDYAITYGDCLAMQRGAVVNTAQNLDPIPRFIRNGRDLGQWVHVDALYQAYFNACLILLGWNAPLDAGNPYNTSSTQEGFGTFGGPHILSLVTEVATRALKAVWFQKWYVHRRLRPEVFAGRIHNHRTGAANYPIHQDILNSGALQAIHAKNNNCLLPMAFPEGSPTHPAYGAGHATVAGACTTILKAWFNEDTRLVDLNVVPKVASDDGLTLEDYAGADANQLTVGGELNKVAANVAIGRNFAGVHWRSDYTASIRLGEQVAIGILKDVKLAYNEEFYGFSLTTFDGETVTV